MPAPEQGEAKALEISNRQGKFQQGSKDCTSDGGLDDKAVPFQKAPTEEGDGCHAQDLSVSFLQTPLISCIGNVQNKTKKLIISTQGY